MSTISVGRNHTERVEKWQSCRIERRNEFRELYDSSPHCSHAISFDVSGKISEPVNSVGAGLFGLVSLGREPGRALWVFVAWRMRILGRVLCELEVSSLFLCQKWLFGSSACRHRAEIGTGAPESFLVGIGAG